jgi:hypothetical protein
MDTKIIDEFIKKNSTYSSRARATYLLPKLMFNNPNHFQYSCKGSKKTPYLIKIDLEAEQIKSTSCTCPYEGSGVCKHTIASLNLLKKQIENGEILLLTTAPIGNKTNKGLKSNQILLENQTLDLEKIQNLAPIKNRYMGQFIVDSINKTEIASTLSGWNYYSQKFSFDTSTQILTTSCNCSKAIQFCEHRVVALQNVVGVFGANYFADNYLEEKIKTHLAQYNLTLADDYEKIFSYEITPKGVMVKSNFKNIMSTAEPLLPANLSESTELLAQLPYNNSTDFETHGMGFCVEIYKKKFSALTPLMGKLNKLKNDFASSLKRIEYDNLDQTLLYFEDKNTQTLITDFLQINSLINFFDKENDISALNRAFSIFKENLDQMKEGLLFYYDAKNSLVRKNITPLTIVEDPIKLYFQLTESEFFYTLKAKISIDGKNLDLTSTKFILCPLFILYEDKIYPIENADLSVSLHYYSGKSEMNYFKKDFKQIHENVLTPLSKKYEIQTTLFKKDKANVDESKTERQVYISDLEGQYVVFKPCVQYENQLVEVNSPETLLDFSNPQKITYKERNQAFEDNFIEDFTKLHPKFAEQEGLYYLTPEELFENFWMLHATERMQQMGIKVFGANELKSFKFNVNKPIIRVNLNSNTDWFDIEIDISYGNQKASLKELQKAFLKKSNYVTLGDGTLGLLPEDWMRKFSGYFKAGEIKKNGIQISNYQFGIIDELYQEVENKPTFLVELYEKKKRLQNISNIEETPIPKGIKAKLRDYQHHGLNWLVFLHKNQLGGCLADDMGLGKTLQTISFLQYLKLENKKAAPSLIIAPTSLIFNWKNEIEKFCPTLKLLTFVGPNRLENKDKFGEYDLVISTYGSLLNDVEFLKEFKFNYVVLDESQAIKNPNSKRYKAVRLLHSYNKIALTGTPIENNTFDLYAQLNFLNPGLLGNMSHFKTSFSDAIDKEKSIESSQLLSKIISPFVLRRTKEQVAKELPDKTESVIYCEMETEQRKVYDSFKNKYRDYLLSKIDENGVEKSQMYILEGLTKLRQICNSTALINEEQDYGNYSVKLESLIENIKEKTGNHKILVFSQFVKMLKIIKTRLEEDQILYEYLDGETKNRQEKVENFQNNTNIRVFLISLKAGGTGLNLTEADYVFIVDPWWNPAVENQAIDRCYRIGQTKNVMAYRMICKDTIEEKIVALQSNKKALASSIISIDEEKKSFDIDQVKAFFS